jgi:hypothetical protein
MSAKKTGKRSVRAVGVVLAAVFAVLAAGCATTHTPRDVELGNVVVPASPLAH